MGPKKKKKLTKEERARIRAEEIDRIRKEEEYERQRVARAAEEQLVAERVQAEERARQAICEQSMREQQLTYTANVIDQYECAVQQVETERRHEQQWQQYMQCDGLPDPASPPAMHTYLHVWRTETGRRTVEQAIVKTAEVLGLLALLDDIIENPGDASVALQKLWQEVRQEIREEQQSRLDEATYDLLRKASHLPPSESERGVVRFHNTSNHLALSLWASLTPPTATTVPSCDFPELGVSLQLPPQLSGVHAAVRALWLRYDHYSDLCPSRDPPPPPEYYTKDLLSIALAEWQEKIEREENDQQEAASPKCTDTKPPAETSVETTPPSPEVNELAADSAEEGLDTALPEQPKDKQAERERQERETMTRVTSPTELNLRKFAVLGGVLHLDLLEQPPQPRELSKRLAITVYALLPLRDKLVELQLDDISNIGLVLANLTAGLALGKLEHLTLSATGLTRVPYVALSNLASSLIGLKLQGNTFQNLAHNSFPAMAKLRSLDLRRCSIMVLSDRVFEGLTSLSTLLLSGNRFTQLNAPFKDLVNLIHLDLSGNPDQDFARDKDVYKLQENTFAGLTNLYALNLAESKILGISNVTFHDLINLKYLSLCNTYVKNVSWKIFYRLESLMALDLSGTTDFEMHFNVFHGLHELRQLYLMRCNLSSGSNGYEFLKPLKNLETLDLSRNRIRTLSPKTFQYLTELSDLRLDYNFITSWNDSIFRRNFRLNHVSIRSNQLTYFTDSMLHEFSALQYLAMQNNPLFCDCRLQEFVMLIENSSLVIESWYDDLAYTCFDAASKSICPLKELSKQQACGDANHVTRKSVLDISLIAGSVFLAFVFLLTVMFRKRNNLRYLGLMLKNAVTLTLLEAPSHEAGTDDVIYNYDAFVSYCENDRNWVVDHLLPALEKDVQLRVCLHERDFQPGYGILENIIHCIDRSRALLIIVSENSLKSHWCQFEMHLAQHRLIETRREQLILVLMTPIPSSRRPRTLHYLMATQTYLIWDPKEENLFWKRLKRALLLDRGPTHNTSTA